MGKDTPAGGTTGAPSSGGFFSSMGTGIEDAFSSASDSIGGLFEPDKPFGSSVDPSKAEYDHSGGTGAPENLEAIRLDAEYGDEGEPLNESAVKMEKLYDDWEAKKDIKVDPKEISKGLAKAAEKFKSSDGGGPIAQGSMPGMPSMPRGSVSYTPVGNDYGAQTARKYAELTNRQVEKLLSQAIRPRSIKSLV
tara:strand:+ start:886 stop:1464 length:579 start_codon:yes stop_codon:yes gene_type:complete